MDHALVKPIIVGLALLGAIGVVVWLRRKRQGPNRWIPKGGRGTRAELATGRIVLRLLDHSGQPMQPGSSSTQDDDVADLYTLANRYGYAALLDALRAASTAVSQPPGASIPTRRLIRSVLPSELRTLEQQAASSPLPPVRSLLACWIVDAVQLAEVERDRLLLALQSVPQVATAYLEQRLALPTAVTPDDEPYSSRQHYLDEAPTGVGVRAAWGAGLDGAGVAFADVEWRWNPHHQDLSGHNIQLICNQMAQPLYQDHGTSVLGVAVGADNATGIIGLAPKAGPIAIASAYDGIVFSDLPDAIVSAAAFLFRRPSHRGVLLIELATQSEFPVEVNTDVFDSIRLATGLGITVIEPAGNGGVNLDLGGWAEVGTLDVLGPRMTRLERGGVYDSGAVLVGSVECRTVGRRTRVGHLLHRKSNFGSRIDSFAWGECVVTCGGGSPNTQYHEVATCSDGPVAVPQSSDKNTTYRLDFDGTSAAAAIIAGVAILLHQLATERGVSATPGLVRQVLSEPPLGTPVYNRSQIPLIFDLGRIGVMPDLEQIVAAVN